MKAQAAMLDIIKELRTDKARYAEFKGKLTKAKTDEERADMLVDFVIKDQRVRQVVGGQGGEVAMSTTVTVTTVIIIAPSAY